MGQFVFVNKMNESERLRQRQTKQKVIFSKCNLSTIFYVD